MKMGKLKVSDNWGHLTYTYVKPDGTEEPFDPSKSGWAYVQWPDKTVERMAFSPVKRTESVHDHGYVDFVPQIIPTVHLTYQGYKFNRPLADFSGVYDIVLDK